MNVTEMRAELSAQTTRAEKALAEGRSIWATSPAWVMSGH